MNRVDWNALDEAARNALLQRPTQAIAERVRLGVAQIFAGVARDGDAALQDYTRQFDGVNIANFEVSADEFAQARAQVHASVQAAIIEAAGRIEAFHRAGISKP